MPGEIPWALRPQKRYVFRNAFLVDPVSGRVYPNSCVKTRGGKIDAVYRGSDQSGDSTPVLVEGVDAVEDDNETVEVDLEGRFLCPGLIDCHVHMNAVPGEKDLWRGR
ncbi:hypothetical protein VTK73DRAFT_9170 [Phialemonium thermophilum]|uniref:Amidohydrolase-related domain-containing protein n=1 Tax=Phialemonium thermophilum TaxID=223376 RepID=A0ABR3W4D9_9PEZI